MLLRISLNSCKILRNTLSIRSFATAHVLRNCSKVSRSENIPETSHEWRPIYKYPPIRLFSVAGKIKVYQGILTVLIAPLSWAAESSSILPQGTFNTVTIIGVTGFLALSIYSLLLKNLVGFIYLDSTEQKIKLAYVGFLGQRKEVEYLVKDVIRADDLPPTKIKFFYPLAFHGSKEKYIVFYKGGAFEDIEKFGSIFGYDLV
ncbi:uncharacterized protein LOC132257365 [Phlebotomus argentipes]|uniref:uncharacterized protein LOC132257365 n=1 Tax=Phlebotomus argentipes TaxID=94469 RepID=UPI00289374E6|nr:uncharacterized protein LOC132257365 [Phlebotomus argentipes]